jgi:hypothetical protein
MECLLGKGEALSSNLDPTKKKKNSDIQALNLITSTMSRLQLKPIGHKK